jgi:serine/threonine protein kinase
MLAGFTLDGTVKILDFGLAKIVENASVESDEVYQMSGETGSLRYMAPEVADGLPYHWGADVYSFGIILWELNATKKPFDGLNRELFYERVVHGGERPPLNRKWPKELTALMTECWDADMHNRPRFSRILERIDGLLNKEKGGTPNIKKNFLPKISGMIDRHSTWF